MKAVILARVSSKEQETGHSLDAQKESAPIKTCILCNKRPADTREHKFLASIFKYISEKTGKNYLHYRGINSTTNISDLIPSKIQGKGAKILKYEKNLCSICNSKDTQKMDNAFLYLFKTLYETLIDEELKNINVMNSNITGLDVEVDNIDLQKSLLINALRYLGKYLLCRIDYQDSYIIPESLREFVLEGKNREKIQFSIEMRNATRNIGHISIGELWYGKNEEKDAYSISLEIDFLKFNFSFRERFAGKK